MSLEPLARDVRHGVRRLIRDWHFTAGAVLVLGAGIGANTAIFSVVNAALFRDSPLANSDRLVDIYQNGPDGIAAFTSYPAFNDMAESTQVFAAITAASVPGPVNYLEQGAVRRAVAEYVTAAYPPVLGLRPSLGRWFSAAEDRSAADVVAVLGHQFWTRHFEADPSVIGRTIRIEGVPVTIVGVGPAGYNGTINLGLITDLWLPVTSMPALNGPPRALERGASGTAFLVKARLRDGVTVGQAQAAMDILARRLARDYPDQDPGRGITVIASSDVRVHPQIDGFLAVTASLLLASVASLLAIACTNLATLLLVRGNARAKEVSVRLALGATRRQLVRHLVTESMVVGLIGGVAGCVIAWWGLRALTAIDLPVTMDVRLDVRVLGFAIATALVTGVLIGLAPALKAARLDLVTTLRDEAGSPSSGRRWFTLKNSLVAFQVAVSIVLLSATGAFLRLMLDARNQPPGFAIDGVALLETDARYAGYSGAESERVYLELRRRVGAIPGVQSTALTGGEPMQTTGVSIVLESAGDAGMEATVSSIAAGPGYFETLDIPILIGRGLDERDSAGARPAAVISERTARRHFGGVNAVGRRFRMDQDPDWIEVVGIAGDTGTADPSGDLIDGAPYVVYRWSPQLGLPLRTIVARSSLDAAGLVAEMQRAVRAVDPALPVIQARTMAQHLEDSLFLPSLVAMFLGGLGALGIVLAGVGLYAVVAFTVSRRSREIGIRMALGARTHQVVWPVAKETGVLMGAGTVAGVVLSLIVVLGLRQVSLSAPGNIYAPEVDPLALLVITLFVAVVGIVAAYWPARRAARIHPLRALRRD